MGKIELVEHMVMHCAIRQNSQSLPIFGTMGPRPKESCRMIVELLQSTLNVFRHIRGGIPKDDKVLELRVKHKNVSS